MNRRLLAFLIAWCVMAGATPLPATTITLVCRMTGLPMQAVLHRDDTSQNKHAAPAAQAGMPCCIVHIKEGADGKAHFALNKSSCCDLRITNRSAPSTASFSAPISSFAPALAPRPATVLVFFHGNTTAQPPLGSRPTVPRGPPSPLASLRAPPSFS